MGRSSDFKFWDEKLPIDRHSCGDCSGDQIGAYSPPLWRRKPVHFRQEETSNLLPQNHNYSCPSPTSRLRAIVDGRRELMEMIKDMPESSYELSLKDIVDDQQKMEGVEEKKVERKRENRIPQKSKNTKSGGQICRSESMESEVFLLKMFLPVFLSSKKKPNARKQSKVCPGKSFEGSEKQANKDWWRVISLSVKDNQTSAKINSKTCNSNSNGTSLVDKNLIPGQWSFSDEKRKSRGQRGCLF